MKIQNTVCCAVIAAAGLSSRMGGGISKQFLPLLGVPAIVRTLTAFDRAETIRDVVVVCRAGDLERMKACVERYGIRKVTDWVAGGETRQQSVFAGIAALPADAGYIAVHDGARPLTSPEEIDACVREAFRTGAAALGFPLKDTVKRVDASGLVLSTPERQGLWAVQTPQVFERGLYLRALRHAEEDGGDYTDDCQLIERIGARVYLCRGSYENIKLTTAEDIAVAEAILERKKGQA